MSLITNLRSDFRLRVSLVGEHGDLRFSYKTEKRVENSYEKRVETDSVIIFEIYDLNYVQNMTSKIYKLQNLNSKLKMISKF